jgi:hypothetical protein
MFFYENHGGLNVVLGTLSGIHHVVPCMLVRQPSASCASECGRQREACPDCNESLDVSLACMCWQPLEMVAWACLVQLNIGAGFGDTLRQRKSHMALIRRRASHLENIGRYSTES